MKSRRIKSKSFSRMKHHHPRSHSLHNEHRTKHFSREFFHFPFSFVFCLLYLLSRNVSLVFCHRFRYCYWLRLCFTSFQPHPKRLPFIVSFHSTNIHTNIFQSSQTRYTKVISHLLLLLLLLALLLLLLRGI